MAHSSVRYDRPQGICSKHINANDNVAFENELLAA